MQEFDKASGGHVAAPDGQVMVGAVALPMPALVVAAPWVGAEQHAPGLQGGVQRRQHLGQCLARHMKQGGVGKHPVKMIAGKIQGEKILLPYLAAAVLARHLGKTRRPFQPHGNMPLLPERLQIAARPAAKIQERERHWSLDELQQSRHVLADIMVSGARIKIFDVLVVVGQDPIGYFSQLLCSQFHWLFHGGEDSGGYECLLPDLKLVAMPLGWTPSRAGDHVNFLHFPISGIISLIYNLADGSSSEVALVGNEGMVGISIFMGGESMPSSTEVQCVGHAYRLNRKIMKKEFSLGGKLQDLVLLYTQALISQTSQTAVCNQPTWSRGFNVWNIWNTFHGILVRSLTYRPRRKILFPLHLIPYWGLPPMSIVFPCAREVM